jgi:hypothetical protein
MGRMTFIPVLILLLQAEALFACTVCGVGKEESRLAFIITTGLLTFIPLIMIGFIVYYIYRQVKARDTAAKENLPV